VVKHLLAKNPGISTARNVLEAISLIRTEKIRTTTVFVFAKKEFFSSVQGATLRRNAARTAYTRGLAARFSVFILCTIATSAFEGAAKNN
jgi:hypothetical protein